MPTGIINVHYRPDSTIGESGLETKGWVSRASCRLARSESSNVRRIVATVLFSIAIATPASVALADGLAPCDGFADVQTDELSGFDDDTSLGEIEVSMVARPSFQAAWGLQIFRGRDRYLLRYIRFERPIISNIYREVRPGTFESNPDAIEPTPTVHVVALSTSLAIALQKLVSAEVGLVDPSNGRMGFDGDGFFFHANGQCGFTWSPAEKTRPERLVDIFENLKIQAWLPTRLVQLFWEKRILAKLNGYNGSPSMSANQYLAVLAILAGIAAFGALPLILALLVSLIPNRLLRKRRFVIASGALSYGFTCFVALLFLPFFLLESLLSAQLEVDGYSNWALPLGLIVKFSSTVLFVAWIVISITVPIYMRRRVWLYRAKSMPSSGPVISPTAT